MSGSTSSYHVRLICHVVRDAVIQYLNLFFFFPFSFSESAKGSDSEDDFLRQKPKAKAASDSDSDSDIGRKKGKRPPQQKCILEIKLAFLLHLM